MGMAVDEFFIKVPDDIPNVKVTGLRTDLCVEYDVQQDVSQFFLYLLGIFLQYGISQFICFLQGQIAK